MDKKLKFTKETSRLIELALAEDLGTGDITSESIIPADAKGSGVIISREALVVCGQPVVQHVFQALDPAISYRILVEDGTPVGPETVLAEASGSLRSLLTAERTVLNFMQRLSGIATHTSALQKLAGDRVQLLDTRKTAPGMRELDKYGVRVGGGTNHRAGLFDMVLIKNNHIDAIGGDIALAINTARAKVPKGMKIEIEVRSLDELTRALEASPDIILLDNFTPAAMREAVAVARKAQPNIHLEASGGITESTLPDFAATGVDYLSMGALTHSVRAADISFRIENDQVKYRR